MTQNASTREETADLQPEDAFFKFTEAIRDNSSLLVFGAAADAALHPGRRDCGTPRAPQSNTMLFRLWKPSIVLRRNPFQRDIAPSPGTGPHCLHRTVRSDGISLHPDKI